MMNIYFVMNNLWRAFHFLFSFKYIELCYELNFVYSKI